MKKQNLILLVLLSALGVFFGKVYLEGKAKRNQEEKAEILAKEIEETIKLQTHNMATRAGAIDNWLDVLKKDLPGRGFTLLTINLEKLWLTEHPILFTGSIIDIATYDKTHYKMRLQDNRYIHGLYPLVFQVELRCPKSKIDGFLKKYEAPTSGSMVERTGVAVIAKIHKITDGEKSHIKIGEGELIDILPKILHIERRVFPE